MKTLLPLSALLLASAGMAFGQGTFIYDQQSSPSGYMQGASTFIQSGQSFIPTFSSIQFIQLNFEDSNRSNGLGASVYLSLRSGSITGAVLATTAPVFLPDGFGYPNGGNTGNPNGGPTNFFFATPVIVTPGTTYYFDLNVISGGDAFLVDAYHYGYSNGQLFILGQPSIGNDMWFREGIIVPKPSKPVLNPNGSVTIQFSGVAGTTNVTQATTNLSPPIVWQNVATNVADANGLWQFIGSSTNAPARFYRGYTVSP